MGTMNPRIRDMKNIGTSLSIPRDFRNIRPPAVPKVWKRKIV